MKQSTIETWVGIASALAIIGFAVAIAIGSAAWSCDRRWSDSGRETRWGVGKGCQVRLASGRWVPERSVRAEDE